MSQVVNYINKNVCPEIFSTSQPPDINNLKANMCGEHFLISTLIVKMHQA